ncbi:MAG TPA: hypothetical protein VNJ08_04675 [Bacteriovoracaceae bacterium]|nr:hypothetical protein [Bacteriovoracaceae bacterium]
MKMIVLLSLLTLVSCSDLPDEVVEMESQELFRFEPEPVSASEELPRIQAICDALKVKEERLPTMIGSSYTLIFSEKTCADTAIGAEADVPVTIERPEIGFIFKKANGDTFAFPDVETSVRGSVSAICANIHQLSSPMLTSEKGAIAFTTFTSRVHCASDHDTICIHIKKGELVSGLDYKVHSNEWLKFKTGTDKTGFYVERKIIANADCPTGKNIEKRARLK